MTMMTGQKVDSVIYGHCLCRSVNIAVENPDEEIEICHCDMCRRWGGAFYGALTGNGNVISGEDFISAYRSSDWAERAFCNCCGSNLWFRFLPTGSRSFHTGLFPDADQFVVQKEIFVDEKAAWSDMSGQHQRQTGVEVIAEAEAAGFKF